MKLLERLNQQRVKYIVESYRLQTEAEATDLFAAYLERLLQTYPTGLIELALVETLLDGWRVIPLVRGTEFLAKVHHKLQDWEQQPFVTTITPSCFQQITGLDPLPVFGSLPQANPSL